MAALRQQTTETKPQRFCCRRNSSRLQIPSVLAVEVVRRRIAHLPYPKTKKDEGFCVPPSRGREERLRRPDEHKNKFAVIERNGHFLFLRLACTRSDKKDADSMTALGFTFSRSCRRPAPRHRGVCRFFWRRSDRPFCPRTRGGRRTRRCRCAGDYHRRTGARQGSCTRP